MSEQPTAADLDALAYVNFLAEDADVIAYRPTLARLVGSVLGAIYLQQVTHYWKVSGGQRAFYKFAAPCSHKLYREGDSWLEVLAYTRSELTTAQACSSTKIIKGVSKAGVLEDVLPQLDGPRLLNSANLVAFWTDGERVTWYQLNVGLLGRALRQIYLGNAGFRNSYVMQDSVVAGNAGFPSTFSTESTHGVSAYMAPENSNKQTEAQRQASANVPEWTPKPGQPSKGELFDALCKICQFNYYRAKMRARMEFDEVLRSLKEDNRSAGDLLEKFGPAWLTFWRCLQGNNRPPTPAEVAELYDQVINYEANAQEAETARKQRGNNNGKETNADRLQQAAEAFR